MKKIVLASDSFKETLSSLQICDLFKEEFKNVPNFSLVSLPIADGGEGSLDAISSILDGKFIEINVKDLYLKNIKTKFYVDYKNNVYIESASCIGLGLANSNNNPGLVSSYGVGEQIKCAIKLGYKNIFVFLGGSATNDGGVGIANALGVKFYDENNVEFLPVGLTLKNIKSIANLGTNFNFKDINIYVLSDVNNVFYGPCGAAYVFAKQKGATDEETPLLDEGLKHLSNVINKELNIDISNIKGSGAAGGIGGGLIVFCNAKILSGINTLLDLINFDNLIQDAYLVISGEGKLDNQSFNGKVIDGIANRCIKYNKKLDLIVGINTINKEELKKKYPCINNVYETNYKHLDFDMIKDNTEQDYKMQISNLINDLIKNYE